MTPSINLGKLSHVSFAMESKKEMDEIAVVLKRFGDEQSTLLDQFERLSFEVHLSQAMLGRSLSEPGASRSQFKGQASGAAPLAAQVKQGSRRRGLGFDKFLKKLLKPILGRKRRGGGAAAAAAASKKEGMADPKDPRSWKAFSRSLRI
ncbi:hypothetical protein OIU79_021573 [Salix purpurea]|uniref:Uncharacterized protein n=1 Tax=Salix purpurea TaxID=77065 RepID=A0A9Q0WGK7_SALPP|nr:hypothetical protein OIU79_021573 [Salix purpurea]